MFRCRRVCIGCKCRVCINRHCKCYVNELYILFILKKKIFNLILKERQFFIKVNERLSKPNIFILNNRWDATAYEPETADEVKNQHLQIDKEFLCNELKLCDSKEAENRIFFVSARETLLTRTQQNPILQHGHQYRSYQFENFESEFEKTISMSAVKTKFDQPSQRGKVMVNTVREFLEQTNKRSTESKSVAESNLRVVNEKLDFIEKQLQLFTQEIKDRIRNVMDEVEKKVSITLNDEIKRLYSIIDEYERPFHPDEHQLSWYKKELHTFVEQKLGSNLSTRLTTALSQSLEFTQKEIRGKIKLINIMFISWFSFFFCCFFF